MMLVFIIFSTPLLSFCVTGMPVALLQEDGKFSNNSYLVRKDLTQSINDFTLCARLSLNYLRGERNYWLSIGNATKDNLLTGVFDNGKMGPRIVVQKFHPDIDDEISINFERFDFQGWHHYCFIFTSVAQFPYPGGYVNLTNKAYMDGVLVNTETKTIIKSKYEEIDDKVTILLGQKLDYRNRGLFSAQSYDVRSSFSGRYSDLRIWKGEISGEQIQSIANCEDVVTRGVVLNWDIGKYNGNGVSILEYKNSALCQSNPLKTLAIFNHGISHPNLKLLCKALGDGQLPTFGENNSDRSRIYKELSDLYESAVDEVKCKVSEYTNAEKRALLEYLLQSKSQKNQTKDVNISTSLNVLDDNENDDAILDILGVNDTYFWSGIIEVSAGNEFVNEYTYDPILWDVNIWPGPINDLNTCTMVRGNYLEKQACDSTLPCGLCTLKTQKRLKLKGLCVDDLKENADFDTEFYAYGLFNGRLHFRGIRASRIYYDSEDNSWNLESLKTPGIRSKLSIESSSFQYPIGRQTWRVDNNDAVSLGICGLENGASHILTLSDCHPNKFTCDSGHCLELEKKCDGIVDCEDRSDELNCEFLLVKEDYTANKLPLKELDDTMKVFFSIDISAFPKIDPSRKEFTSDHTLNLRWYDPRLIFRDLNNKTTFNSLNPKDKKYIWKPQLAFLNALGPSIEEQSLHDEFSSVTLNKENKNYLDEDFSLPREARLLSGDNNSISLKRKYSQQYTCNFNLFYYPFDTQVCNMAFEFRDKTEDYVQFIKDGEGIHYKGDRNLAEYEILVEDLNITTSQNNHSLALVKVVFRRQGGFHLLTSFAQSLVIIFVAFMTFFFHVRNFSDRIMVNLILLLILATINSTAQSVIPHTSYYKIIDVWFLFLVVLLVLTITFHSIIMMILGPSNPEYELRKFHDARLFRQRENGSSSGGSADEKARKTNNNIEAMNGDYQENIETAKLINLIGMIAFVIVLLVFNVAFWVTALSEQSTPGKDFLNVVTDIF